MQNSRKQVYEGLEVVEALSQAHSCFEVVVLGHMFSTIWYVHFPSIWLDTPSILVLCVSFGCGCTVRLPFEKRGAMATHHWCTIHTNVEFLQIDEKK